MASVEDYVAAGVMEGAGGVGADPRTGARDQHNFVCKTHDIYLS